MERLVRDVLRQLSLAVSSYRLYPGDPTQPGFVSATERLADLAARLTRAGPVGVEVRRGAFVLNGAPLEVDEPLRRLAAECFDHRLEWLAIQHTPTPDDVVAISDALASDGVDVAGALQARGVTSIVLSDLNPGSVEDAIHAGLSPDQRAMLDEVADHERVAANLLVGGLPSDPTEAAKRVIRYFEGVHAVLPAQARVLGQIMEHLRAALELLPQQVAREVLATMVTRADDGALGEEFVGSMTDPELAKTLMQLEADGGPDSVDLARRLAALVGRSPDLVELTQNMHGEGTRITDISDPDDRSSVRPNVADLLGSDLLGRRDADRVRLQERFPDEARGLAQLALYDYLRQETNLEALERVLETWTLAARQALRARDAEELEALLAVLSAPAPTLEASEQIAEARRDVAAPDVIRDLLTNASDTARGLLGNLGGGGVEAVLDTLADEEDRGMRAQLVSLASDLSHDHTPLVTARLDDARWFVVRNAVTILGRVGSPDVLPELRGVARHDRAEVRRELVRSLVLSGGAEAVPDLRRLAVDPDASVRTAALNALSGIRSADAVRALAELARTSPFDEDRERAIELLGKHPDPEAAGLLDRIAKGDTQPKLSRALRRTAKTALKARG